MDGEKTLEQLQVALGRRDARIQAMMEVGRSLTAESDLDELLMLIVDRVTELMEAERSTIFLIDPDTGEVWSKVAQGENLTEILLDNHFAATACESAREALDLISDSPPDLIIMDNMMPGMTGMTLLPLIKREYPAIKIIMITAFRIWRRPLRP